MARSVTFTVSDRSLAEEGELLVAADCTAYSAGDFHTNWLRGKRLAIACPKLDHGQEIYLKN